MATYQSYELSARAVMSSAEEKDGVFTFHLNRSPTEHPQVQGAQPVTDTHLTLPPHP